MAYGARYYNHYYDFDVDTVNWSQWRWTILQDGYTGPLEQVNGRVHVTWGTRGSHDPFQTIFPSSAQIEILSQTDEQFAELYTNDERKYLVYISHTRGGGGIIEPNYWKGYLVSGLYSAPYDLNRNYTVTFKAADMLENLKEIPFGDENGDYPTERMTVMAGILMCLQRTEVDMSVYEAVQIAVGDIPEDSFDGTSALEEIYFDPLVYVQDGVAESCYDVLDSLLRNVFSRVYQSLGLWIIESIPQKLRETVSYRTRTFLGVGSSSTSASPRVLIRKSSTPTPLVVTNKLVFHSRAQMMEMAETFGTINIIQDHGLKENNTVLTNGGFDDDPVMDGSSQVDGWSLSNPDPTPTIAAVSGRGDSHYALQVVFDYDEVNWQQQAFTNPVRIAAVNGMYKLQVSFDIYTTPYVTGHYLYFDWSLGITGGSPEDFYVGPVPNGEGYQLHDETFAPTYLIDGTWNRVYIDSDEHNRWHSYSFQVEVDSTALGFTIDGDLTFKLRINGNPFYDHADSTALIAETTDDEYPVQNYDNRRRQLEDGTATRVLEYLLRPGVDNNNGALIIRPGDFHSTNNPFVWELQKYHNYFPGTDQLAGTWLIDNVVLTYLPEGGDPEESSTTETVISANTHHPLTVNLRHGDLPDDSNYQNISRGYFSFDQGGSAIVDTGWMIRTGSAGASATFLDMFSTQYEDQYSENRWKLSGIFHTRDCTPSLFNTFHEVRNGRMYIPTYLSMDTKQASADWEGIEVFKGTPLTDSGEIDSGDAGV